MPSKVSKTPGSSGSRTAYGRKSTSGLRLLRLRKAGDFPGLFPFLWYYVTMRVKVYFNLHKKTWSILHMTPKGWRLWGHSPRVILSDVRWKVSEAGRQRVLRERRKNVHAFAIGTLMDNENAPEGDFKPVRYNPYECTSFCTFTERPYQPTLDIPLYASKYGVFTPERRVFACQ